MQSAPLVEEEGGWAREERARWNNLLIQLGERPRGILCLDRKQHFQAGSRVRKADLAGLPTVNPNILRLLLLDELTMLPISSSEVCMVLHVFVALLVVCFLLCTALLWRLDGFHFRPSSSRGAAKRSTLPRLLKHRSPHDCPVCRLASTPASAGGSAPAPVRPWREVKSRRGAPKRIDTDGFACPNPQCTYFGNTEARVHALVGDG